MNYIDNFLTSAVDSKAMNNMLVNSHPVGMELDTGSQLTILSKSVLSSIMNVCLTPSDRIIRVSNGQLVSNLVQGSVEVRYNGGSHLQKLSE